MKTKLAFAAAALLAVGAAGTFAVDEHQVVFTEGAPVLRDNGVEQEVVIGDVVQPGQTIVTGPGDRVDLESGSYRVSIAESSVFTLMQTDQDGASRPVLKAALGRMSFVRQKLGGTEPRLAGSAAICGVRGTDVTLVSGADGTTLIVVDEGAVDVSAAGATVQLAGGEAVEVPTGAAPGPKYRALSREIDFSKWSGDRLAAMLEDPAAAAARVERQLDSYIEQMRILRPLYDQKYGELEAARTKVTQLNRTDRQAGQALYEKTVVPLQIEAHTIFVNLRFYALSALSLRRIVEGRLYAFTKARYIAAPGDAGYQAFLKEHARLLAKFETAVVPELVAADI
jgi:hypothetical protein